MCKYYQNLQGARIIGSTNAYVAIIRDNAYQIMDGRHTVILREVSHFSPFPVLTHVSHYTNGELANIRVILSCRFEVVFA